MKILILKPSSMGDVIHALPVLRLLKRHLPESEIYWWIESTLAPLLEGDQDLAGVIPFNRRGWESPRNWLALWSVLRWTREQAFDWVIDLQCLARSGAFAWLANGKLMVGLDEPRELARGYYDLVARRPSFHTHAVDWYRGVLPLLGVPDSGAFEWLPARPAVAGAVRQKWLGPEFPWVVLQPGARWVNKRWPAEHFAAVVRKLADEFPTQRFAVLGGADDRALGQVVGRAAPQRCLDLTGELSLQEMVEAIRLADVMVTNDTGPMHVAAAVGTPVVALFGPTEPRRTGPYGQLDHVLQLDLPCVPCLKSHCRYYRPLECLRALSVERVFEAVRRRLESVRNQRSGPVFGTTTFTRAKLAASRTATGTAASA